MNRRNLVIAVVLLVGGFLIFRKPLQKILPSGKITPTETPSETMNVTPQPIPGKPRVQIETAKGRFVVELRPDVAPKTVANFLTKFSNGYCVNKTFHRVEGWVVQGCDPKGDGTGGTDSLPTETSSESFTTGSLGVARKANPKEISNDSQFFIVKTDSTFLDGEYTYFGKVVSGLDIVNSLSMGDKIISTTVLTK